MPVVTQTRSVPGKYLQWRCTYNGQLRYSGGGTLLPTTQTTTSFRSGPKFEDTYEDPAVTASQSGSGLAAYRSKFKELKEENHGQFDNGHNFSTRKTSVDVMNYEVRPWFVDLAGGLRQYSGYMLIQNGGLNEWTDAPPYPTASKIASDGRKAISRTIPTAPEASMATFLGELRERLPQAIGHEIALRKLSHRTAGAEYLNVQFGLRPFIADLQKMALAVLHATKLARQYQRDSGRVVRRRTTLYDTTVVGINGTYAASPTWVQPSGFSALDLHVTYGPVSITDMIYQKCYFSGAFSYHLSKAHSFLGKLDYYEAQANHLLGLNLTVDTIWELTPWSWLFDWNADIGRFMSNVSALSTDSTVLRYGYVMHHTSGVRIRTQTVYHNGTESVIRKESLSEEKLRTKSNPYGFDTLVSAYSPKQWSILAALGMTRAPTSLR